MDMEQSSTGYGTFTRDQTANAYWLNENMEQNRSQNESKRTRWNSIKHTFTQ